MPLTHAEAAARARDIARDMAMVCKKLDALCVGNVDAADLVNKVKWLELVGPFEMERVARKLEQMQPRQAAAE